MAAKALMKFSRQVTQSWEFLFPTTYSGVTVVVPLGSDMRRTRML